MPPPTKSGKPGVVWWLKENAYDSNDHVVALYELQFEKDVIKPGNIIKIKNMRGTFRFRCVGHNASRELTWVDCMSIENGSWHSFPIDKIKCLVKPKRSRRKKVNA